MGLWVIMMRQYRFTSGNKCTPPGEMLIMAEAAHACVCGGGGGVYGKAPQLSRDP